ncbi:MAG TPA: RsmD family RNA methyltransferase [Thermoanaerobaculia bacterium]|nr:RsmD family RNA methyltransferase [Thermoanaerobaculia bacterium]
MVRISAGSLRGRRLQVPEGIRPTTELARKAAFDILGEAIVGASVLDACAGSGAYGLEALSRGADHATFVESNRRVARVLRGNVERLDAGEAARVEEMSVARFSSNDEEGRERRGGSARASAPLSSGRHVLPRLRSFDVIFHDPPFEEISESDLQLLLELVRAGGWLFHERGDDRVFSPGGVEPADRRRYGTTRFLIFRPARR